MKKKHIRLLCVLMFLCFLFLPTTTYADIGPKPSVVITFTGLEDETYYVTLLSAKDTTGPYSYGNPYYEWMGEEWVFDKFCAYDAPKGYYFLSYMENCSDDDTFEWGYYPPQEFKILLYFPEHDSFLELKDNYKRYAFDSYFTVDIIPPVENTTGAAATVRESYDITGELVSFVLRIICTIFVEILIALLFSYREQKWLTTIAVINIVTQVILNILLNIFHYYNGPWAFIFHYIWMEFVVFGIEAFLYCRLLPRSNFGTAKKYHPCWYAFTANVISFIVGMQIEKWIPQMF